MTSIPVPQRASLTELVRIGYSKGFRVFRKAFGRADEIGQLRVGRAAPHKGVKGIDNIRKLGGKYVNMANTLESNIAKVRSKKGTTGVAVGTVNGELKILPAIAMELSQDAGHASNVRVFPNRARALEFLGMSTGAMIAPEGSVEALPGYE